MSSNNITQNMPNNLIPSSGTFIDGIHHIGFRIYYENTDMGNVVFYAEYLKFLERARTEFLRHKGLNQRELAKQGTLFVVFHVSIDYKKPARMDDEIVVKTQLTDRKKTFVTFKQDILRGPEALVKATVKVCCINALGKPAPLPTELDSF